MKTRKKIQHVFLALLLALFSALPASAQSDCHLKVSSVTIVREGFLGEAGLLTDGTVINRDELCRLNFRADLCELPVGSVRFVLDNTLVKTENSAPYAFWGDVSGSYKYWIPTSGSHTLVITAYSSGNAGGQAGVPLTINFSVIGSQTSDACRFAPVSCASGCDDGSECTLDLCVNGVCTHASNSCDDANACTQDLCSNGICTHAAVLASPSYLKVENPAKSWNKLKLGYSNNLWSPKQNVIANGNNQMCITLRTVGTPNWSKLQIRPQGSTSGAVTLSNYITGSVSDFTTFCIPFSAFTNFGAWHQLSYIELPVSNGADPFEIQISKVEFTGGLTPFLWFGDPHTSNVTDNGSVGALKATLISGAPCDDGRAASKTSAESIGQTTENESAALDVFPNPFNEQLNFEFILKNDSDVSLELFSATGAKIATIFSGNAVGSVLYKKSFHTENLAPGFYIYRLKTNADLVTEKVLLAR